MDKIIKHYQIESHKKKDLGNFDWKLHAGYHLASHQSKINQFSHFIAINVSFSAIYAICSNFGVYEWIGLDHLLMVTAFLIQFFLCDKILATSVFVNSILVSYIPMYLFIDVLNVNKTKYSIVLLIVSSVYIL